MVGRHNSAYFALRSGSFNNHAELPLSILAVLNPILLSSLLLRVFMLSTLLKQALDLDSYCAPGSRARVNLLQALQKLVVLYWFAHFVKDKVPWLWWEIVLIYFN